MSYTLNEIDFTKIKAIIFDIDGTLYDNQEYMKDQVDVQIRAWASEKNISYENACKLIEKTKDEYEKKNNGKKTSLANTLTMLGVTIEDSIHYRETLLEPKHYLNKDPLIINAFDSIPKKIAICAVTNNPKLVGRKTLEAIGINQYFQFIIGLDDTKKSKPSLDSFLLALSKLQVTSNECISVGDREDVDIVPAITLGMQGLLIKNTHDVINFLKHLKNNNS